jgi:superfamily II DNA/RNA helicase
MTGRIIEDACELILHEEEFIKDFVQLTRNEFSILKTGTIAERLNEEQVSRLLETAALFSLNKEEAYQKIAFKIAIYLLRKYRNSYPAVNLVVQLIITRLGDLPTIKAIRENGDGDDLFAYYDYPQNSEQTQQAANHPLELSFASIFKFPEIITKKMTNRISMDNMRTLTLTDFKIKIYRLLHEGKDVAFSAPTSSGKSFLIHNYIAEKIRTTLSFCAIYIAPTKALIAEVQAQIRKALIESGLSPEDFSMFIAANELNSLEVEQAPKKVFVLTQERLQEMLSAGLRFRVDLLVVDEAQKIGQSNRGVIIEDTVRELISRNSHMQKIFIAPYIENIKKFKEIFDDSIIPERTSKSPVGQNHIFVNFDNKRVSISIAAYELGPDNPQRIVNLDEREIEEASPKSRPERVAWVVNKLIPPDEPTLVYCDKRSYCRSTALHIGEGKSREPPAGELEKAIEFLTKHVHPEYYLIDALQNRIGYHYGKMPQFVRFYVKELFEKNEINILCCTSTLLEGVNLPAKNIVLYNPKFGSEGPMDRLSILNLAGRAGRLMNDYYGSIFCVNKNEWEQEDDIFEDKLEPLESSIEKELSDSSENLIKYLTDFKAEGIPDGIKTLAISLMVRRLKNGNSEFLLELGNRNPRITPETINSVAAELERIANQTRTLNEVIQKNRSIDPRLQFQLYNAVLNSDLISVPCPNDSSDDFYGKLQRIFKLIWNILLGEESDSHIYYTRLAYHWISQDEYSRLIKNKINKGEREPNEEEKSFINRMIDELEDELEKRIKYEFVRGLKCYSDILEKIASERGLSIKICKELPILLEAGAFDKRVILLLSVGLSRNSAIEVFEFIDETVNSVMACLKSLADNFERIKQKPKMPKITLREIEKILDLTKPSMKKKENEETQ